MRYLTLILILLATVICQAADKYDTFVWSAGEIGGRVYSKAAILVPLEFQGISKRFYAQLDTGSDATILYGRCLQKFNIPIDSLNNAIPAFRWYGHEKKTVTPESLAIIDWTMGADTATAPETPDDLLIGTIGLDKVMGKILVLDFPETKYAVVEDTAALSEIIPAGIEFIDGVVSYNKFYINVVLGEDTIPAVRYDCGSSIAVLLLPRDWWQWATGLEGNESEVLKDSVPSWGRFVHTFKAQSKYDMILGSFCMRNPMVTFVDWPDPGLLSSKFLGNAAFYDSCVVVVDCIREKFGVRLKR
jgi:hypothetical protein